VTSCAQLEKLESLVLGELAAPHAADLRAHAARCRECARELELLIEERALFTHRAEAIADPPATVAFVALRRIEEEEATRAARPVPMARVASIVPAAVRFLRRGHVSAACAAALFLMAAFSRLGAPATSAISPAVAEDEDGARAGLLASLRSDEPLACSAGWGASAGAVGAAAAVCALGESPESHDDARGASLSSLSLSGSLALSSSSSSSTSGGAFASSFAAIREELACGSSSGEACAAASCEPSVTCWSLRQ
jgi:hypothetical protein